MPAWLKYALTAYFGFVLGWIVFGSLVERARTLDDLHQLQCDLNLTCVELRK